MLPRGFWKRVFKINILRHFLKKKPMLSKFHRFVCGIAHLTHAHTRLTNRTGGNSRCLNPMWVAKRLGAASPVANITAMVTFVRLNALR